MERTDAGVNGTSRGAESSAGTEGAQAKESAESPVRFASSASSTKASAETEAGPGGTFSPHGKPVPQAGSAEEAGAPDKSGPANLHAKESAETSFSRPSLRGLASRERAGSAGSGNDSQDETSSPVHVMRSLPAIPSVSDEKPLIITRASALSLAAAAGENRRGSRSSMTKKKRDTGCASVKASGGSADENAESEDDIAALASARARASKAKGTGGVYSTEKKSFSAECERPSAPRRSLVSFGASATKPSGRKPDLGEELEDEGSLSQLSEQDAAAIATEITAENSLRGKDGNRAAPDNNQPGGTSSRKGRSQVSFGSNSEVGEESGGTQRARPRRKRDPTPFVSRAAAGIGADDDDDHGDDNDTGDSDAAEHSSEVERSNISNGASDAAGASLGTIVVGPSSGASDPVGIYRGSLGSDSGAVGMGKRTITFGRDQVKEFESEMEALSRQTTLKSAFSRDTSIMFDGEKELALYEQEIAPSAEIEKDVLAAVPPPAVSAADFGPLGGKADAGSESSARKVSFGSGDASDESSDARGRGIAKKGRRKRDPTPFVSRSFLPADDDDDDDDDEHGADSVRIASNGSSGPEHVQFVEPTNEEIQNTRRISQKVGVRSVRKRDPTPFIPRSHLPPDDEDDGELVDEEKANEPDMKAVPISRDDEHVQFIEPSARERESVRKASVRIGARSIRKRDPTPFVRRNQVAEDDDDENDDDVQSDGSAEDNPAPAGQSFDTFAQRTQATTTETSAIPQKLQPFPSRTDMRNNVRDDGGSNAGVFRVVTQNTAGVDRRRMGAADLLRVNHSSSLSFPTLDPYQCDVTSFVQLDHVYINVADLKVAAAFYIGALGMVPDPRAPIAVFGRALWLNYGRQQLRLVLAPEAQVLAGGFSCVVPDLAAARLRLQQAASLFSEVSAFVIDLSDDAVVSVTCPWGNAFRLREAHKSSLTRGLPDETMMLGVEAVNLFLKPGQSVPFAVFYQRAIGAVVSVDTKSSHFSVRLGAGQSLVVTDSTNESYPRVPLVLCVYSSDFSRVYSVVKDAGMLVSVNDAKTEFVFHHAVGAAPGDQQLLFKVRSLMHPEFCAARTPDMAYGSMRPLEPSFGDNPVGLASLQAASCPPRVASGPVSVLKKREVLAIPHQAHANVGYAEGPLADECSLSGKKGISFGQVQVKEFTMDDARSNTSTTLSASRASSMMSSGAWSFADSTADGAELDAVHESVAPAKSALGAADSVRPGKVPSTSDDGDNNSSHDGRKKGVRIVAEDSTPSIVTPPQAVETNTAGAPEHVHFNEPSAEERGAVRRESVRIGIRSARKRDPTPFVPRSFRPIEDEDDEEDEGYPGGSHERGRR